MTAILLDVAWKSVITLGITLVLLQLLRQRSAAQRAWIAHIGLVATLLLPLAVTLLPPWEVAAAAPVAQMAQPVTEFFEAPAVLDVPAMVEKTVPAVAAPVVPVAAPSLLSTLVSTLAEPANLVALLYGVPAALLFLMMLVAVGRLFALRARALVMVEQSWLTALAHAQRRMNFKHGTALLVSNEIHSPISWGVLRPVILLNEEALTKSDDAEAIIAHELAHVARLDWASLLLARMATALFWFNPLVWLVARQAHQLREEAADDAVLCSNVDHLDYAALLVGAARHEARGFLLAANGVAPSRGSLRQRVTRVLDEGQLRAPAHRNWIAICVLVAAGLGLPLAALSAAGAATGPTILRYDVGGAPQGPVRSERALVIPQADARTTDVRQLAGANGAAKRIPVRVAQAAPQQEELMVPQAETSAKLSSMATSASPVTTEEFSEGTRAGIDRIGRREFAWDGGDTLLVSGAMTVRVRRDGPARVVVTGPAELVERVFLRRGQLGMENKRNFWSNRSSSEVLQVEISGVSLKNVSVDASSEIALGTLQQDSLTVGISGSGSVAADGRVGRLDVRVSGSGSARLPEMRAREGRLSVSGSGSISVLAIDSADLSVSGSGHISGETIHTADVSVPGSGQVLIIGRPRELLRSISGSGRLVAGGETFTKSSRR